MFQLAGREMYNRTLIAGIGERDDAANPTPAVSTTTERGVLVRKKKRGAPTSMNGNYKRMSVVALRRVKSLIPTPSCVSVPVLE